MTGTLDTDALQRRYDAERDKRRAVGNRNFRDPMSVFPEFGVDPWAEEKIERDAIAEECDVLVTGTGIAGVLAAVHLAKAGVTNIRMVDFASDFGGVWYWNRYPGIRCDIEAYIYLPLIEEIGTVPSERYAAGDEIRAHIQALARKYDLYERTLFQTQIRSAEWNDSEARWIVTTNRGDRIAARFLIGSSGFQHVPKVPDIEGIESFDGAIFHPSRWDFSFSGGTSRGNLTGLAGKKVALIGTGATGIQILPHLARHAEKVYLVQRTPAAISPRNNHPTDVAWFTQQLPGWQTERQENFYDISVGNSFEQDLLDDCWTREARKLALATAGKPPEEAGRAYRNADFELMEELRARIDDIIERPELREALKPWYNLFCKRPLFADDYLECFNLPNVELVDTEGKGVERITSAGFIANDTSYDVDGIIIASGFEIGTYSTRSSTFPIIGRDGTLAEKLDRPIRSVHGLWFQGFPNFQMVGTAAHSISSFNYTWSSGKQAEHAAEIVATALRDRIRSIEVTEDAEERWTDEVGRHAANSDFFENCTPGYFNNEGDGSQPALYSTTYAGGGRRYIEILEEWRSRGFLADTILTKT